MFTVVTLPGGGNLHDLTCRSTQVPTAISSCEGGVVGPCALEDVDSTFPSGAMRTVTFTASGSVPA